MMILKDVLMIKLFCIFKFKEVFLFLVIVNVFCGCFWRILLMIKEIVNFKVVVVDF